MKHLGDDSGVLAFLLWIVSSTIVFFVGLNDPDEPLVFHRWPPKFRHFKPALPTLVAAIPFALFYLATRL